MNKLLNSVALCRCNKRAEIIIACSFATILFIECCLFFWQAFHSIMVSSLWTNPLSFWSFYATKLSISIFFGSLILIFRNKIWSVVVLLLINVHMFAELIYYRANGIFLDTFSVTMIGNMDGFWGSVPMYINASDFLLVAFSILYICILHFFYCNKRNFRCFCFGLIISIILNIFGCLAYKQICGDDGPIYKKLNPFDKQAYSELFGFTTTDYQKSMSVIHALIYNTLDLCRYYTTSNGYMMTTNDINDAQRFISPLKDCTPNGNLQLFVIESLEGWVITPEITPNIWKLTQRDSSVLFAPYVKSERRGGNSADGQLIINTGLLPIQEGAACFRYPCNVYPSLSELYNNQADIIPGDLAVWNQKRMSDAYKIKTNYVTTTDDKLIFSLYDSIKNLHDFNMVISMSSHSPFEDGKKSYLELPNEMPEIMKNYIKSINYMDEQLGMIINQIDTCDYLSQSTIVITGDHSLYTSELRDEFVEYCKKYGAKYNVGQNYTALIIYSPFISNSIYINNQCYQMDIFPTTLNLIDCKNYYWNGLGVNLLDSLSNGGRRISESEAFFLSDKLIRSNFFDSYLKSQENATAK